MVVLMACGDFGFAAHIETLLGEMRPGRAELQSREEVSNGILETHRSYGRALLETSDRESQCRGADQPGPEISVAH